MIVMLPEGKDMEERFLNHFFEEDDSVTTARSTKQGEKESASAFGGELCLPGESVSGEPDRYVQDSFLHTKLRAKMVGARPKTLADLLDAAVEAEAIIRDREQEKTTQKRTGNKKDEKEDKRGKNSPTLKERMAKEYDFDVEDSENLFHQPIVRGRSNSHRVNGQRKKERPTILSTVCSTGSSVIISKTAFKEKVQELLDKNVISGQPKMSLLPIFAFSVGAKTFFPACICATGVRMLAYYYAGMTRIPVAR